MGVAAALSTAQTVFPVTDADFQRIAETSRIKTFDYTNTLVGSTGARFLQIEAKGTHDNKSTRSQARDIRLKKARQAKAMRADGRKDMAFAATVLDVQHQSKNETRITFCDPPADTIESDPFVYRLLARLTYYWQQIRYIVPTGRITVALANRLRALEAAPDQWQSLREVPLVAGNGEPLEIPERMGWTLTTEDDRFRPTRVFGTIIDLRLSPDGISRWSSASELPAIDPPLLFIGLDEQVLVSIVTQDYHAMSELLFLPSELRVAMPRVSGSLYRVRSGLVSGRIDHRDWRKEDIEKQISRLRRRRRR
jgi:hypothetical protein